MSFIAIFYFFGGLGVGRVCMTMGEEPFIFRASLTFLWLAVEAIVFAGDFFAGIFFEVTIGFFFLFFRWRWSRSGKHHGGLRVRFSAVLAVIKRLGLRR